MTLTEWIIEQDLSIKEFTDEFVNVVIENFGTHNYKHVVGIVNDRLTQTQTCDKCKKEFKFTGEYRNICQDCEDNFV